MSDTPESGLIGGVVAICAEICWRMAAHSSKPRPRCHRRRRSAGLAGVRSRECRAPYCPDRGVNREAITAPARVGPAGVAASKVLASGAGRRTTIGPSPSEAAGPAGRWCRTCRSRRRWCSRHCTGGEQGTALAWKLLLDAERTGHGRSWRRQPSGNWTGCPEIWTRRNWCCSVAGMPS